MVARRAERLEAAADELAGRGFTVCTVAMDAAAEGAAARLVEEHTERHGGLHVVVANAGRGSGATVAETSSGDIDRLLAVNVTASFALARAAIPTLRHGGRPGWFIVTSSLSGIWPVAGFAGYSASKAALVSLARSIAAEEAADGVRSCAICPAFVETAMTSWLEGSVSADALLDPNDVAETVRYLLRLSPSASVTEIVLRRAGAPDQHAP